MPKKSIYVTLLVCLVTTLVAFTGGFLPTYAAPTSPESSTVRSGVNPIPKPHLGYGIHIAPNTNLDPAAVARLGMNWVKLYDENQIPLYPNQNILFRLDQRWPDNWEVFRRDMRTTAARLAAAGVDAIEVHNEPNLIIEWPQGPNGWEYTQLLRVAYAEIKAVAPQITVVSAGLAPTITTPDRRAITDIDFAREMFDNGAGNYFDAFGYHPYGFAYAPEMSPAYNILNFRRVELLRQLMVEYGLEDKQIWMTEFGWMRDPAEEGMSCSTTDPDFEGFAWLKVDGRTQADYIVRSFDYADKNWEWAGPMFLWNLNWSLIPPQTIHPCNHMRWFALLRPNGQPTLAYESVVTMPRRPVRLIPEMTLVARDDMTVDIGVACPAVIQVGQFEVENTGARGTTFIAEIRPAQSLSGPKVTVSPEVAAPGEIITVYADTRNLQTGLYVVFINVRTEIAGQRVVRNIRGYIAVKDSFASCN